MIVKERPMQFSTWSGPGGRDVSFHDCPSEFFYKIAGAFGVEPHTVLGDRSFAFYLSVGGMDVRFFREEAHVEKGETEVDTVSDSVRDSVETTKEV